MFRYEKRMNELFEATKAKNKRKIEKEKITAKKGASIENRDPYNGERKFTFGESVIQLLLCFLVYYLLWFLLTFYIWVDESTLGLLMSVTVIIGHYMIWIVLVIVALAWFIGFLKLRPVFLLPTILFALLLDLSGLCPVLFGWDGWSLNV